VARGLKPRPQAVHIGHFSTALRPLLMINPGDIVTIETATRPSNSVSSARASWVNGTPVFRGDARRHGAGLPRTSIV
jgi:acetamidase/formamidase